MENDCWPTPGSDQQLHQHQSAPYNTLNSCAGPDNVSQLDDLRYSNMDHGSSHFHSMDIIVRQKLKKGVVLREISKFD
ncbi:hypothetical protein M8J76_007075 [Diaphorina citri]|nr:hypothetical protein M8J76_007075 [Diaphorina citri]